MRMAVQRDFNEYPPAHFDEHPMTGRRSAAGWWVAAGVAVIAVVGAASFLSIAPVSPARPPAAHERGMAAARIETAVHGRRLVVAHAAEAATLTRVRATESAAQAGAASADAASHDAAAVAPAPQP
jgi:hypothetical protein